MQAFVFYLLRSGFKSVWDDGLADWKAVFVMSITTTFALISLAAVIQYCFTGACYFRMQSQCS